MKSMERILQLMRALALHRLYRYSLHPLVGLHYDRRRADARPGCFGEARKSTLLGRFGYTGLGRL